MQRNRRLNFLLKSKMTTGPKQKLIIGCGKEGHALAEDYVRKNHQHEKNGDITLDINPRNNPHFVGDITQSNIVTELQRSGLGTFPKIVFENVPYTIFTTAERCEAIAANIAAAATEKSKVSIRTGRAIGIGGFTNLAAALESKGFEIDTSKAAEGKMKAVRK